MPNTVELENIHRCRNAADEINMLIDNLKFKNEPDMDAYNNIGSKFINCLNEVDSINLSNCDINMLQDLLNIMRRLKNAAEVLQSYKAYYDTINSNIENAVVNNTSNEITPVMENNLNQESEPSLKTDREKALKLLADFKPIE